MRGGRVWEERVDGGTSFLEFEMDGIRVKTQRSREAPFSFISLPQQVWGKGKGGGLKDVRGEEGEGFKGMA